MCQDGIRREPQRNDPGENVDYDYMGSETPLDASAEIEFAHVRRAVHRFVADAGARDEAIHWRTLK